MWDLRIADARALPFDDGCAHTCVTSPPYFGLRDYGHDGQIGLDDSLDEYVRDLVQVFQDVRRVLRDDGTLWLNLGDSYASTTKGSGGASAKQDSNAGSRYSPRRVDLPDGVKPKDLMGIPWRVAFALQADGWYLRSDIIWHKTNPMPESVKDRPTKGHEYLFLLSKSERYFYDADAIKEPASQSKAGNKVRHCHDGTRWRADHLGASIPWVNGGQGRNKRSVWTVTTTSYKGAHFATYPPDLIEPCILAGSPDHGTVLDPFTGSGTTGAVAIKHGRRFIGTELNSDYGDLARERMTRALEASGRATAENTGPDDRVQLGLNLNAPTS
ncbi:hypothetical protein CMI37_08175 [Candidatus Pacearchaeota archaeon]|nr:hypothetical protein [Candidatus Pacearchaeota archaeon]